MARAVTGPPPAVWRPPRIPLGVAVLALLASVIAAASYYVYTAGYFTRADQAPRYQTVAVQVGNVTSTVVATGPISSPSSLPLTFKSQGKLVELLVSVGDRVAAGQVLARLDTADLEVALAQAQASVDLAEANLAKTAQGPREEAVAVAAAQVDSARTTLATARKGLATSSEGAVRDVEVGEASVASAIVGLEAARKNVATAISQQEATLAADRQAVANAERALADAEKSVESNRKQVDQSSASDRVAVQNAEASLKDAQTALARQQQVVRSNLDVSQRNIEKAEADLKTQKASRSEACKSTSTSSCSVAKRQMEASEASLRTVIEQREQTKSQGEQSVMSAQSSVTSAQNALKNARAALASSQAKYQDSVETAETAVNQARDQLKTAQATLTNDIARQQASVVTAQNSVEQAQATLDSSTANLAKTRASSASTVQNAQGQVDSAAASLANSQANLTQAAAPPTQAEIDALRAQVDSARASLVSARNNLAAATLVAPTGGTVSSINGALGQYVSGGAPGSSSISTTGSVTTTVGFITLTDISSPQVTAQVSEADIGRVRPGQAVTFTVTAFPGRTFAATVTRIEPVGQTVSNVVNYNVVSTVDPTDASLLPTMTATVSIVAEIQSDVLIIPNSAISFAGGRADLVRQAVAEPLGTELPEGQRATVLFLRDGTLHAATVSLGISDDRYSVVRGGLTQGDEVVVGQVTATAQRTQSSSGGLIPIPGPRATQTGGRTGGGQQPAPDGGPGGPGGPGGAGGQGGPPPGGP
ncbi:MAG: biotin/lipoyl-binding protein [Chloroflexota bacterium]